MTDITPPPNLAIDIEVLEQCFADCNATDEEKQEYLELLWQIISEFVAYGWNIHPIQQVTDGDNSSKNTHAETLLDMDMLQSLHIPDQTHTPQIKDMTSSRHKGVRS